LIINPSGTISLKVLDQNLKIKTNQTSYISSQLYWDGTKNYEYSSIFFELIKKINCFVDIGANIGYYSTSAALINKEIKIYAIEPSVSVIKYLKQNIEINGLENQIKTFQIALSDSENQIDFFELYNPKYPNIDNLSGEHNSGTKKISNTNKYKVNSISFDAFCSKEKIEKIDLIKIDTEGYEAVILEHSQQVIERDKPIIICETLFNKIEPQLEKLMLNQGYKLFNHIDNFGLKEVTTIIRTKDNGVRNCFFVHPSKINLIEEFIIK